MNRTMIAILAAFLAVSSQGLSAEEKENKISGDLYVAGVSKYLARGMTAYHHSAIQPGLDLKTGGLTIGVWSSIHLGPTGAADPDQELANGNRFGEADFTVSYEQALPFLKTLLLTGGFTFYTFPCLDDQTVEISLGLAWEGVLEPSLTVWYDPALGNGTYIEAAIVREWTMLKLDWEGNLTVGYNYWQWGYDPSFTALGLTLTPSYAIGPVTISLPLFGQYAFNRQYHTDSGSGFDWTVGLACQYDF